MFYSRELKLSQIHSNLQETQQRMTDSMKSLVLRGHELEDLDEGAVSLETSSRSFERKARSLRAEMCCQKYRWYILAVIVLIVINLHNNFGKMQFTQIINNGSRSKFNNLLYI